MTQDYDLLDLIEDVAASFATSSRTHRVHLGSFMSPELCGSLHGDKEAISVLLSFLVEKSIATGVSSNAEPGQFAVLVEGLEQSDSSKNTFRIGVSDTRSELDKDRVEELINSYSNEVTPAGTVQSLLDRLESRFQVDERMLGRTCRIFFECAVVRSTKEEKEFVFPRELADTKVFLVSNDPPSNRIIQHYCRFAGIHLEGAPTAVEAVTELGRTAKTGPFQILAVAPPIEDSTAVELARIVRQSSLKNLKLLFLAPFLDPRMNDEAMGAGFDEILVNPFRQSELFAAIQKLSGVDAKVVLKPIRALIVEDNPINAKVAFFQLRELGFESETVENGKRALEALAAQDYDFVLMDLQMPIMDGIAATKAIREGRAGDKEIPIIALTANDDLKKDSLSAGCNFFLTKPAAMDELNSVIQRCLGLNNDESNK